MIHILLQLAASAVLLAIADPAPSSVPAADPVPDKISYAGIGNGWTGGRTSWSIDRAGRGHYESTERGRRISERLDVGTEGFERLRLVLAPLETLETMPCDGGGVTDQANGGLSWTRGKQSRSLRLDFGCARGSTADAWTRFDAANSLLDEWTARGD